ncbi:hypothetical protein BC939DRAFT_493125 [Gamsiella multidivaricata]|uniref:uncharacterized protein n=1 Tax=Gamsiella multidivaricata TaxID=101098 RepID=UPI00221FB28A|nr:uncharacterized protein BC939DRAFT_493125 [Gamsiella multidivaricata]KAI7823385.1 hypothetical protein BC939DRAFT_493125 [Gamsiella multidivaricata]
MHQPYNYISLHDISPEGRFVWVSESIFDVLGYTPEEIVGRPVYEFIYSEDIAASKTVHKENVMNDLVASQVILRYVGKDGRPVACTSVFSLCYDFVVNCSTIVDPNVGTFRQFRAHSVAMTRIVGSRKEEFERIKRHQRAFDANSWNHQGLDPEPRACMILNRFSRSLLIMYASPACELIFHLDPEQIVGKPILLFIRADDLGSFVEQVDMVKSSSAITHMRFWFQSPNWPQEIPCEAMLFGAVDGMVAVLRRCKPFIRKRMVGSAEQYSSSQGSSWSSISSQSYLTTPATSASPSPPSVHAGGHVSQPAAPVQNLPMSRLNRIRIVDLASEKIRPLADIPKNDPMLLSETSAMPKGFGIREYRMDQYEEDDDDDNDDEEEEEEEDKEREEGRFEVAKHFESNVDVDLGMD